MPRLRDPERLGWPKGLREPRPGYFTYRSPITGREVSLGTDFAAAKKEAVRQNDFVKSVRLAKREIRQDTVHGIRDARGLLEPSYIAAHAMQYDCVTGVYFLLENDTVVYVGQSTDVLRRLSQHRLEAVKTFNRVYLIACQPVELTRLEAMYIDKFKPRYNSSIPQVSPDAVVWRGTFSTVLCTD